MEKFIEKFLDGHRELTSELIPYEGYVYAANSFVLTRVQAHSKRENHPKGANLMKLMAPKEGKKIGFMIPFIAEVDYEPLDLTDHIYAEVNVGVFDDGTMSLWGSLSEEKKNQTISRINIGLLNDLTGRKVDFYFRGKLDSVYFETEDGLQGTLMPCKPD